MWVGDLAYKHPEKFPLFAQRLKDMNITAITLPPGADPAIAVTNGLGFYIENIVNRGLCLKWNSHVIDWDRFVTEWAKQGRPASALVRDYCLDDPAWRSRAKKEMREAAAIAAPHDPLLYNIRDELSVTISANPFDYDFSPAALNGFRQWLQTEYPKLDALNREWETQFPSWNAVTPFTTDQIKNRMATGIALAPGKPDWQAVEQIKFDPATAPQNATRWNFSPWADFRTYMDKSLADALNDLRQAGRETDPRTPIGIEGTQMPSAWGGYDLWRLSQVVDWVEPYDIGNAREIFGSFMPGKPVFTTVFETDANMARRRLWHLLLEGDAGCLIWWSNDCIDWTSPDYKLSHKGEVLAPVLKELQSPLARLFAKAEPQYDPISILYSQPGIQVDWLIESTVDGSTWLRRFSSFEASHNRLLRVRDSWLKAFQDLGYSPKFVSSEQIENGALRHGTKALILPQALALSDKESEEIQRFAREQGHFVFADGQPGIFDQHGKLRQSASLKELFRPAASQTESSAVTVGSASHHSGDIAAYSGLRLQAEMDWPKWIQSAAASLKPAVRLPLNARVRVHSYRLGKSRLIALERNISYAMSEDLKQAGGNEALETPLDTTVELTVPGHLYNLRTGAYLGNAATVKIHIDPWQPTLLAVLPEKIAANPDEVVSSLLHQTPESSRKIN
jgi:hypothetical protein